MVVVEMRLMAFKYRLSATKEQTALCEATAGCCRLIYNVALEHAETAWKMSGVTVSYADQCRELAVLKREPEYVWLKDVPGHALQQAAKDYHTARSRFFKGHGRYPRRKRKGRCRDSFRLPEGNKIAFKGAGRNSRARLPKFGWVKFNQHRPLEGKVRYATVSRDGDHWYVSFTCAVEIAEAPTSLGGAAVAVDVGIAQDLTLSDGTVVELATVTQAERDKLARLGRELARKTKGSKNRGKARRRLNRFLAKLRRRRNDAIHKATHRLATSHAVVCVEDLKVKNMTASAKGTIDKHGRNVRAKAGLNRSLLERAPHEFRRQLSYKCEWYGSRLVTVPAAYTSQRCSRCGHAEKANRPSQARFSCTRCNFQANADHNAALNILAAGTAATACQVSPAPGDQQQEAPPFRAA